MIIRYPWRRRGIALPITLLVASIIVVLAAWMVTQGTQAMQLSQNDIQNQDSVYAAEAGLAFARDQLRQDIFFGAAPGTPASPSATGAWDQTKTAMTYSTPAANPSEQLQVTLTITNNWNGSSSSFITAGDGTKVPGGCVYVQSRAAFAEGTNQLNQRKAAELLSISTGLSNPFTFALFALDELQMSSNDTTHGENTKAGATVTPKGGSVASLNGDWNIALHGAHGLLDGNVAGPGSAGVLSANAGKITGVATTAPPSPMTTVFPAPGATGTVDVTGGTPAPGFYRNLTGSVVLKPGIYVFNNISAGITLTSRTNDTTGAADPSQQTFVFFYGNITENGSGGTISATIPGNLMLIEADGSTTGRTIDLNGVASISAAVYAPHVTMTLHGNGSLTGGMLIDNLLESGGGNSGGTTYDENLPNFQFPTGATVSVKAYSRS